MWRTPAGKRVSVRSERMVSLEHRHLAVLQFEVTLLDGNAPIVISSQLLNRQDGEDEYHVTDAALDVLTDLGYSPEYGARPLKRFLQRELETRIGRRLIAGDAPDGSAVAVELRDGQLEVEVRAGRSADASDNQPVA